MMLIVNGESLFLGFLVDRAKTLKKIYLIILNFSFQFRVVEL